jgi:hypothetical protein
LANILNEILGRKVSTDTVTQSKIEGEVVSEWPISLTPFSIILGKNCQFCPPPPPLLQIKPVEYANDGRDIPHLQLGNTNFPYVWNLAGKNNP